MEILQYGDPALHIRASEVTDLSSVALQVPAMAELMVRSGGAGLAATQVGILKRFFIYDFGNGLTTLVNPVIVETSGKILLEEHCLSVPFPVAVERARKVTVRAFDLHGSEVVFQYDGITARLMQHELDHLDGILIPQRGSLA